jgi:hypothetical protein
VSLFQDFHSLGGAIEEVGDGSVRLLEQLHKSLAGGGGPHGGDT